LFAPSMLVRVLSIFLLLHALSSTSAALQTNGTNHSETGASQTPSVLASSDERPRLPPERFGSIRSVRPEGNRKVVALTFDLCETAGEIYGYDAAVVDCLRSSKVRATFFAGGKYMKTHPEKTMELMSDPLFEIGNHSWTHKNFRLLSSEEMEDQVLRTQRQYELMRRELVETRQSGRVIGIETDRTPKAPLVFRFPFGTCTPLALNLLERLGLAAIQWSIVSGDADRHRTSAGIVRTVLAEIKPGAIVVFHANGRGHGTAEALPVLIPKLRSAGYDFLTVSELLDSGTPVAASECYEQKPGDNLRYDKMFRGGKGGSR